MKFGTVLRIQAVADAEAGFRHLKENGFQCCHFVYKPETYVPEEADAVRAAAEKNGVEISAMFAGYRDPFTKWNLHSDFLDAGINSVKYGRGRIEYVKQAAVFASRLGTENVLIHAGFVANNPFSEEYQRTVGAVKELAGFIKGLGMNLLLETGGESPIVLKRLIEDVGEGNVFVNFDTANLILYGFGNPVDGAFTLGSLIHSVHVKDGLPPRNTKELGSETEFGEGFVDFRRVIPLLKESGFDGPYVIERELSDAATTRKLTETVEKLKVILAI